MSFRAPYSRIERMLHGLAFSHPGLQKMLASIEDDLFAKRFQHVEVRDPVFITSLPRAGTTLLLQVLAAHPSFAAHTYRDMPFVLSPMLWDKLSHGFRRAGGERPRAHGDEMTVGYDTPEAFEEAAWRAFWPEKYRADRIEPWTGDEDSDEFAEFFVNHMRKMVALRGDGRAGHVVRYVSKNNANIARTRMLLRLFPSARIVIPVRHPVDQAGSLLRQHQTFLKLHAEDSFGRRYMESIGHFEFGATLKPIDMGGWLAEAGDLSPLGADYWLAYWAHSFDTLLAQRTERMVFLSYEQFCATPARGLGALAEALALEDPAPVLAQAHLFRPPVRYDPGALGGSASRMDRAMGVYDATIRACVV